MSTTLPTKSLQRPDHIHTMPKAKVEMVSFGEAGVLARFTYEPGFHYAEHVTPHSGKEFEEVPPHIALTISGRLHSVLPDGTEQEVGPDDAQLVPPWHGATRDSWVVGDEPFVCVTFLPGQPDMLKRA